MSNRIGRPSALTEGVQRRIESAIRTGAYPETAARAAGVSERSFYRWMERGEAEQVRRDSYDAEHPTLTEEEKEKRAIEQPFVHFWQSIQKALAEAEILVVGKVYQGGKDWQSKAWIAERRWRERWGRTTRTELTGADGGPVQVASVPAAELLALADELTGGYDEADEEG